MCRSNAVDLAQGDTPAADLLQAQGASLLLRLSRLTAKYDTLLQLRLQREELESNGVFRLSGEPATRRRAVMRTLATHFPGALRELDCWDTAALSSRLSDLASERARSLADPQLTTPARDWVRAVEAYHDAVRTLLACRRTRAADAPPPRGLVARACDSVAQLMTCEISDVRGWVFGVDASVEDR